MNFISFRIINLFIFLFSLTYINSQILTSTSSGNWSNCSTWGNPLYIYSNLTTTFNISIQNSIILDANWTVNQINLSQGSEIILNNGLSINTTQIVGSDKSCCPNLVTNGDFNLGFTGFTPSSSHSYVSSCSGLIYFYTSNVTTVSAVNSVCLYNNGFGPTPGRDGSQNPAGQYLAINDVYYDNNWRSVWTQNVPVSQNKYYSIYYDYFMSGTQQSSQGGINERIRLLANGVVISEVYLTQEGEINGFWTTHGDYYSGNSTNVTLTFQVKGNGNSIVPKFGGDYGLDDIIMKEITCF